jgi:Pyruvate/2-oxoacid:ferredoxin oxidoreductase delta subunit
MIPSNRPRLIAVVRESCTGCEVCVDFCPVDCIDDVPHVEYPEELTAPIRIREEECIGCQVCAKVCEDLDRNAIEMVAIDDPILVFARSAQKPG